MADEYLSDREQEEAVRSWLRDNWHWMLGGVVLGVALLLGWNYWGNYQDRQAADAARLYGDVQAALAAQDVEKADKALAQLAADHKSAPYTQQGRLLRAKNHVDTGKFDEAAVLLRAVVDQSDDEEMRSIAQLRLARVLVQQGKHDDALSLLKPDKLGKFAAGAHETRGDALVAKGDIEAARAEYVAALSGDDARIERELLELKLQDAGGTVPPETPSDISLETAKVQP